MHSGHAYEGIISANRAEFDRHPEYDYYSVVDWDWNLPGRAKAARPQQVADSIRDFHAKGARFYDCESGDCWGPCGLGYYIAARAMWDPAEAEQVQALTEDFLTRAFGPANEPMRDYLIHVYGLWSVTIGQRAALDPQHPLKSVAAFSDQELETILQEGIANNAPVEMGFTPVAFSERLVPSTPLNLPGVISVTWRPSANPYS